MDNLLRRALKPASSKIEWVQIVSYMAGSLYCIEGLYSVYCFVRNSKDIYWFGDERYFFWFGIVLPLLGLVFLILAYLLKYQRWLTFTLFCLLLTTFFKLLIFDIVLAFAPNGKGVSFLNIAFFSYLLYLIFQLFWINKSQPR